MGRGRTGSATRARRNDERIASAAVTVAAAEGWAALSARLIAAVAATSFRPVMERYPDAAAVGEAIWGVVAERTCHAIAAASAPDASGDARAAAFAALAAPDASLRAGAEVIAAAPFAAALRGRIAADLLARLPSEGDATWPTLALGVGAVGRVGARQAQRTAAQAAKLRTRSAGDAANVRAPKPRSVRLHDDAAVDALLQATLALVSERGLHATTTAAIAKRAGVHESLLFSRFGTKRAAFDAAYARFDALHAEGALRLRERLTAGGDAAQGRAIALREVMRPGREAARRLDLERLRLAWWHDAAGEAATGEAATGEAATGEAATAPVAQRAMVESVVDGAAARHDPASAPDDDALRDAFACAVQGATAWALLIPEAWKWRVARLVLADGA
jgi:AcrR family transcriptional regulator